MKTVIFSLIFISSTLFANYAYTGENSGKIDMHGGKKDKLIGTSKFNESPFSLNDSSIKENKKEEKLENLQKKQSTIKLSK